MLRYTLIPKASPQHVNFALRRVSNALTATPQHVLSCAVHHPLGLTTTQRTRHSTSNRGKNVDYVTVEEDTILRPDLFAQHTSLASFLRYASRTSLSLTSTTYLGTRYEYLTQEHLATHLAFKLTRVGGRGDSGIDLIGNWNLPSFLQPRITSTTLSDTASHNNIKVLIQCKRLARSAGPNLIRELEGSFQAAPPGWRGDNVLGILASTRAATKGVREAMGRSRRGLIWMLLEEDESGKEQDTAQENEDKTHMVPQTRIRQFLYNAAAAERCGLEGVDVGLRYDDTGAGEEVQLLWQGQPIQFTRAET